MKKIIGYKVVNDLLELKKGDVIAVFKSNVFDAVSVPYKTSGMFGTDIKPSIIIEPHLYPNNFEPIYEQEKEFTEEDLMEVIETILLDINPLHYNSLIDLETIKEAIQSVRQKRAEGKND